MDLPVIHIHSIERKQGIPAIIQRPGFISSGTGTGALNFGDGTNGVLHRKHMRLPGDPGMVHFTPLAEIRLDHLRGIAHIIRGALRDDAATIHRKHTVGQCSDQIDLVLDQ